ncbi:MAG: hypothetical protein AAFO94_16770 [Bacteroidota bacterium]
MKTFNVIFVFAFALFMTSCAKEEMQPTEVATARIAAPSGTDGLAGPLSTNNGVQHTGQNESEIPVNSVADIEQGGSIVVAFAANEDLSNTVLDDTQTLEFTDANGNHSSLNFDLNSYSGGDGVLLANFSVGTNDLTGLDLDIAQIIIEDEMVE